MTTAATFETLPTYVGDRAVPMAWRLCLCLPQAELEVALPSGFGSRWVSTDGMKIGPWAPLRLWAALFYPLMRLIEMVPGDILTVCGAHDRLSLRIWAEVREVQ